MSTKAIERKLEIKVVKGGHSVPGGNYSDKEFELLLEWADRIGQKQINRLRYEKRYERRG